MSNESDGGKEPDSSVRSSDNVAEGRKVKVEFSSPYDKQSVDVRSSHTTTSLNGGSAASPAQKPFIRIRLINIDHVCTRPGAFDRTECAFLPAGETLRKVPVLRIFGATPEGQRVCLHLHGVFPYCYIPYDGDLNPDHVLHFISRLGHDLNAALTASLRGDPAAPESYQHIAAIHLVKGVPFYGYHVGWKYFLKISFVDPSHNFRLATILQSGRITKVIFQPHEIHIRYQLQFMLDYNVFGCDYIELADAHFRCPLPAAKAHPPPLKEASRWDEESIPSHLIQPEGVTRTSFCDIEIDAVARNVLNRRRLRGRALHHDFDEQDSLGATEKLVPSLTGLWEEEAARRLKAGLTPTPPAPDPSKDQRTFAEGESPAWIAEQRLRALLEARITLDHKEAGARRPRDFTKVHPLDPHIATTFDSVEIFHFSGTDLDNPLLNGAERTEATQLPSTLYDLEHYQSQKFRGSRSKSETLSTGSQEDFEFFGTQAFQSDLADLERQLGPGGNSDEELETEDMADFEIQSEPRTPRKDRNGGGPQYSTPQPNRFAGLNPVTPVKTPAPTPAPRTPGKAIASESKAHFHSPLRDMVTSGGTASQLTTPSSRLSSESESASPVRSNADAEMSDIEAPDDVPERAVLGQNESVSSQAPQLGSQEWFAAHLKAQARWRESAHTQARMKLSGSSQTPSETTPRKLSTVESLTQMIQSKSPAKLSSLSSSGDTVQSVHGSRHFVYSVPAPTELEVTASLPLFGLPPVEYQDPFYSDPADVPSHSREYAGRSWRFASKTIKYLPEFETELPTMSMSAAARGRNRCTAWQYGMPPPSRESVQSWAKNLKRQRKRLARLRKERAAASQNASGQKGTQAPSFGFKLSQRNPGETNTRRKEKQHMTVLAIEIHVNSRAELLPDPRRDPIEAIVYCFQNEDESLQDTGSRPGLRTGLILLDSDEEVPLPIDRLGLNHLPIETVSSELDMFNSLVDIVRGFDPEILVGFEIHNGSWGYVIDRARLELGYDLVPELSRVNNQSTGAAAGKADSWGWTQTSALKITGRHILNIWRLMRGELNLNVYSYENIVFHLLRARVPKFPPAQMTTWYRSRRAGYMVRVLKYWIERVETDVAIIDASELVFRTAEFARIYGIDFFSVISRGSQFKVESVMFRIAKPESFVLPSPNTKQVAEQNAAECLPLIMEPQSAFYKGPLLVLDFQSLYPSVMIAYNLCYSTCLGRVSKFQGTEKFGITELQLPKGLLSLLKDDINISPNGLVFVKPHMRRSLLSKMLTEILDTRVMIKGSMKGMKTDKAFMRQQNARQLSLKLLANVTYGYTSATFSGRMPCVEIADAIVQSGRETLERAIELIHATERWGAQVVYGDTDSLFIYLPERSKDDAFQIGNEIADAVTKQNPKPIKLKFEKVYLPSVLLAKKRYVGFKYEHADEAVPEFNAKGIETVRRDGFPALQRMLEACIRLLFTTQDLTLVKSYCQKQWRSILTGNVSFQDFIIAKEVRLGGYSENGVPPPGAAVSTRRMLLDPRSEPQHAERVPYLITQGEPKAKLNDLAVTPDVMLASPQLQLNALYYITRGIIPPLTRVFNLLGADVEAWFREMPRPTNQMVPFFAGPAIDGAGNGSFQSPSAHLPPAARLTLTDHYRREQCLECRRPTKHELCLECHLSPSSTFLSQLASHTSSARHASVTERICAHCSHVTSVETSPCVSIDCPMLYAKEAARRKERSARDRLARVQVLLEEGPRSM